MSNDSNSTLKNESEKPSAEDKVTVSGDASVQPVENFDLGKVDKDRRIFQNGDTDRTDQED